MNQKFPNATVLMIDNYDSFTYNLVHYLQAMEITVIVKKNDEITINQIHSLAPTHIIISPGPCTPNESGISLQVIEAFKGKIPILGVCLGHQAIGQIFGGNVIKAEKIMHGKTSTIHHNGEGIFNGLANEFTATRYHSLVLDPLLSDELLLTAWTQNDKGELEAVMGIKHKKYAIEGVQFHPESVLSEFGHELLANFLQVTI